MACNGKLTAVNWSAASSIAVFGAYDYKRFDVNTPLIKGHSGAITDLQWSPFQDKLLASSSDDSTIKLWFIEGEQGITSHVTECDMEFDDHAKKCKAIQWHPIAEHVLASYAEDSTVRVWDVNTGDCAITFTDVDETALAMRWSPVGDKIGCMIKKNTMAIFDPRVANSVMRAASHQGPRAQKIAWIDNETIVTSGFN